MGKKYTTHTISIGDHNLDAPVMVQINALIADGLHSEAGYLTEESGTTKLTDAEIAEMGYIKTYTDTDTNTQLSQAQVGAYAVDEGFIKTYTDTNTQLTSAQIAAMGYTGDQDLSGYLPLSGGALTGPISITGDASYVADWGYNTLVLQDTAGYPGINFRNGNTSILQRMRAGSIDMQWAYSTNATATGVGQYANGMKLSGNSLTLYGDVRSPLFYDSNDTNYYLNPAGTSTLNVINATGGTSTEWNTAHGWGNHADAGYTGDQDLSSYHSSNGETYSKSSGNHMNLKHTTAGGYSEFSMSNDSNEKLVIGSIGSGYTSTAWAGSRYIYSTAGELRIKAASNLRLYSGGHAHTGNLAVTFDSNQDAAFTGNISAANLSGTNTGDQDLSGYLTTTGKAADSNLLDGLNSTAYMRDDGWNTSPGQDADTQTGMRSDFSYGNNAPNVGELLRFGAGGYSTQFSSQYSGAGKGLNFRTRNGDAASWNPWYGIWHTGNLTSNSQLANGSNYVSYVNTDQIGASSFYDLNDSNYFLDLNATSRLNRLQTVSTGVNKNSSSTTKDGLSLYGAYTGGEATYGMMFSGTAGSGTHGGVTSDWATYFTMNNSTSRGWIFRRAGAGNSASISAGGLATFDASVRSPIFYDSNNTGYFTNPASTSNLNSIRLASHLSVGGHSDGSPSNLSTSGRITFGSLSTDALGNYSIGTTLENYGGNYNKLDLAFHTGIRLGAHPNYGGVRFYTDQSMTTEILAVGKSGTHVQAANSFRAPIFYDSNDTNYYLNLASTSRFNEIQTSDSGAAPRYDTAFYVIQGQHWYGDTGSQVMYIGESSSPVRLRGNLRVGGDANADSGMKLTVDGSSNATSSFRAPIFYDSNSTSYYMDPSNSNIAANFSGGIQMTGNYGVGITGKYTSTRLQTIFNMGTSYKLPNDGNSTSNAYGLYWSHQNAGSKGGANNLASHGLIILEAGNYKGSWGGGRIVTTESVRAPLFYDSNNTGYYTNPAGTSVVQRITHVNHSTPILIKVNSAYKSWVHHVSSSSSYIFAPSTANGGESWDWANQMSISTSGVVTANNFVLSSDKRSKTKIKDLTCDNIDVSWKSFEMKGNEGDYRTGVIAQELEETNPEFVNTDEKGFKSVKYIDLLIAKIAELEARLEKLEK